MLTAGRVPKVHVKNEVGRRIGKRFKTRCQPGAVRRKEYVQHTVTGTVIRMMRAQRAEFLAAGQVP